MFTYRSMFKQFTTEFGSQQILMYGMSCLRTQIGESNVILFVKSTNLNIYD